MAARWVTFSILLLLNSNRVGDIFSDNYMRSIHFARRSKSNAHSPMSNAQLIQIYLKNSNSMVIKNNSELTLIK